LLATRPEELSFVELVGSGCRRSSSHSFSSRVALETALAFGDRVLGSCSSTRRSTVEPRPIHRL
jgi:hypothetical protein